MAVGVAQGGDETWDKRRLYCLDAAIGAPRQSMGTITTHDLPTLRGVW
ncbi:MAG: hypothetical protein ACSLEN_03360 [Candidatus Malihini olakiniferum]